MGMGELGLSTSYDVIGDENRKTIEEVIRGIDPFSDNRLPVEFKIEKSFFRRSI